MKRLALIALMALFSGCQSPPAMFLSVTRSTNTVVWLHPSNEAKTNTTVITEHHTVFYLHDGHPFVATTNFPVATNSVELRWQEVPRLPRRPLTRVPFPPMPSQ